MEGESVPRHWFVRAEADAPWSARRPASMDPNLAPSELIRQLGRVAQPRGQSCREHASMGGVARSLHPSRLRRSWGWLAIRVITPPLDRSLGEDAFAPGEDGGWLWYPLAGTFLPHPLGPSWRVAGEGVGVTGSLTRSPSRARFVPSSYWRRRGVPDWDLEVTGEDHFRSWQRLSGPGGDVVLRHR